MQNKWDAFFEEKIKYIFSNSKTIVDIGGSLRIDPSRQNRHQDKTRDWILPYLQQVDYKIMDKVPDFNPDVVGDIHELPFADNSIDSIICMAVLEHVEDPKKAMEEVYRVLKPGGCAFIYAPFLFYYHSEPGYFGDFYRYTHEGLRYLARNFSSTELQPMFGPIETALNLFPFLSKRSMPVVRWLDRTFKPNSRQVSGYNMFCIK